MNKLLLITLIFFTQLSLHSENYVVRMLNQGATGIMVFEPAVLEINVGDTCLLYTSPSPRDRG